MREKIYWKIFFIWGQNLGNLFPARKISTLPFSNGFSTAEWRLSLNMKLPLEKTWQVMLHYHSEAGDVKSTYKGFD